MKPLSLFRPIMYYNAILLVINIFLQVFTTTFLGNNAQFISVIQAILVAARHLHQLQGKQEDKIKNLQGRTVRSGLLRKLILTASSSSLISTATRLLSKLNKEAADQKDFHNLFIISDGNFPEVLFKSSSVGVSLNSFFLNS